MNLYNVSAYLSNNFLASSKTSGSELFSLRCLTTHFGFPGKSKY